MSESPKFQEYPKMMVHPGFRPATLGTSADERKGTPERLGTPIKFPPVTVNNAQQEEYHASQGYVPGGNSNPAAFVAAFAAPDVPGQGFLEYPKMVHGEQANDQEHEQRIIEKHRMRAEREAAEAQRRTAEEALIEPAAPVSTGVDRVEIDALKSSIAQIQEAVSSMADVLKTQIAAKPQAVVSALPTGLDELRRAYEKEAEALGIKVSRAWPVEKLINVVAAQKHAEKLVNATEE